LLGVVSLVFVSLLPPPASDAHDRQAEATASSYTFRTSRGFVVRIGAFWTRRDETIAAAERVFGRASSRKLARGQCQVDWRGLRLRIYFANFGGPRPGQTICSPTVGKAQSFTIRGPRFRTWEGLRVGHRSATVLDRHRAAEFRRGAWWLRTAVSPFGDESEYAVVSALPSDGRIRVIKGWIGAAGE
jgi:hypothetical protein